MEGGFGPLVVFTLHVPGTAITIPVTQTVTVTWLIIAVIWVLCTVFVKNFSMIPGDAQNVLEMAVESVYKLTATTMGQDKLSFAPYMGTLLIFIAVANLAGLVGVRPPTADVNTTMALALLSFVLIHVSAVRSKGLKSHLKGLTEPMALLTPINVIGEISTPVSLGFRLFGNIVGGLIIMNLLYGMLESFSNALFGGLLPPLLQIGIPIPLHLYFDVFAGLLQSFIFTMLTMVNVSMAMD